MTTIFSTSCVLVSLMVTCCYAMDRIHYIAIEEAEWDYAPSGMNLIEGYTLDDNEDASVFTKNGPNRIGKVYMKALYKEYTDDTYATEIVRHESLGFLGPPLRGEVGDRIIVHAKNKASFRFSLHPHGSFYKKNSEGALYNDNTSGTDKLDDGIDPDGVHDYVWELKEQHGPGPEDPDCATYMYHSHVDAPGDTNSGLIGPLIVCRPGTLNEDDTRNDVDKELFLIFTVLDENLSWYLDRNIEEKCGNPSSVVKADDDFMESNLMHGMNGLLYGNLKGLEVCRGDKVALHVFGIGTEVDIHTAYFQGQTLIYKSHTEDTFNLFPASFSSVIMHADSGIGLWRVSCVVNDHYSAGMQGLLNVTECNGANTVPTETGSTRNFYVTAEEVIWNYAPSGYNYLLNANITENPASSVYFDNSQDRIGGTYKKAIYKGYTDDTFLSETTIGTTNGILGPLIYAEVGDKISITYKNNAAFTTNIEPQGLYYSQSENVQPGNTFVYEWIIPEDVGPKETDPNCITLMYTSMVDPIKDTNTGLVGPLLICKKGTLNEYLSETTYYILMTIFDENLSHYIDDNISSYVNKSGLFDTENEDFVESNKMTSMNGYMYGNLLGIEMCVAQATNFRVIGLGTEADIHGFHVEGVPVMYRSERVGSIQVLPHTTYFLALTPEVTGSNYIGCYLNDHIEKGMLTTYTAIECGQSQQAGDDGIERIFYISAEEEIHDYNPSGEDIFGNAIDQPSSPGYAFAHQEDGKFIGTKYVKAMYYEYEDESFKIRLEKPPHLGSLGPYIYGEEGDTIKIVFKNMASTTYNIFGKGIPLESEMIGNEVSAAPGESVTYTWKVTSSAVPSSDKPECQSQIYLSTTDPLKDAYSGLIGPLITCRKGSIDEDRMTDTFFLLFMVMDENKSYYLDRNIQEFANADPSTFDKTDADFVESNLMHGINGRIFGVDGLNLTAGEEYLWHVAAYGGEVDLHTVHFHGNMFQHYSDIKTKSDVFAIIPGNVGTLTMTPDAPGHWLMHCHVNDHIHAGMETTYYVSPDFCQGKCISTSPNCNVDNMDDIIIDCNQLSTESIRKILRSKETIKMELRESRVEVKFGYVIRLILETSESDLSTDLDVQNIFTYFPNLSELLLNGRLYEVGVGRIRNWGQKIRGYTQD